MSKERQIEFTGTGAVLVERTPLTGIIGMDITYNAPYLRDEMVLQASPIADADKVIESAQVLADVYGSVTVVEGLTLRPKAQS